MQMQSPEPLGDRRASTACVLKRILAVPLALAATLLTTPAQAGDGWLAYGVQAGVVF